MVTQAMGHFVMMSPNAMAPIMTATLTPHASTPKEVMYVHVILDSQEMELNAMIWTSVAISSNRRVTKMQLARIQSEAIFVSVTLDSPEMAFFARTLMSVMRLRMFATRMPPVITQSGLLSVLVRMALLEVASTAQVGNKILPCPNVLN